MNADALILLVEDNENDVLLTRLAFAKAGVANPHQVVGSVEEAVDYFRGEGQARAGTQTARSSPFQLWHC